MSLKKLVNELIAESNETEWLEFKYNNFEPEMIGRDISALANSAAYCDRDKAYMIWGVMDGTHEVVGTDNNQYSKLKGNQELISWLKNMLSDNCEFDFETVEIENKKVVILTIERATYQTVEFKGVEYVRVGSYTKKLMEIPSMRSKLWSKIRNLDEEARVIRADLDIGEILKELEYSVYFERKGIPVPLDQNGIIYYLLQDEVIKKLDNGMYGVTKLGAILFAKNLTVYKELERSCIRVIQYEDNSRLNILKHYEIETGYVKGFVKLVDYLDGMLPSQEVFEGTIRKTKTMYPVIALREIIANALIHQDFTILGSSITIEVFDNRIEITNPGIPLIDIERIVDNPPKSRNEKLASLMRNLKMCEELGSGWDRIVLTCELELLTAPKMNTYTENTKVTIYARQSFNEISQEDKLWSCYLHACVKYVCGESVTNASLRKRFGLEVSASANISRLIKEAVEKELIKPIDPNTAPKHMKYIPIWA